MKNKSPIRPKDRVFKDTSDDLLVIKIRHCEKGCTGRMINVLDIETIGDRGFIEFESPAKIREIAIKLMKCAEYIEAEKRR